MKKILKIIWDTAGLIYIPVFISFWLFHKIARLLLAISYFGMLETRIGKDIISNLFGRYGRR